MTEPRPPQAEAGVIATATEQSGETNTQNTRKMECQSSIFHPPKSDA